MDDTVIRAEGLKESSVCVSHPTRFRPQIGVKTNRFFGQGRGLKEGWAAAIASENSAQVVSL